MRQSLLILMLMVFGVAPQVRAQAPERPISLDQIDSALRALSGQVAPSVVQIFTTSYAPQDDPGPSDLVSVRKGSGSGVIFDAQGFIVTNYHVIDGARRIQVLLHPDPAEMADRQSIVPPRGDAVNAVVVGVDRETDIAVLKVEAGRPLPALAFANSDDLAPGQMVLAYGSPMGLATSVSMGVVSGVARQLSPENPMIYIQTDASINPGNSGGPLVNARGEVVGINTLILSQSGGDEGIGFAAPSSIVRAVAEQLRANGRVQRGEIGVLAQTINPDLADGLSLSRDWGVLIADVAPNSPADKAGLQVGDVVETLDGKLMENARQFDVNLYGKRPSATVTLDILRNTTRKSVRVEVRERVDNELRFSDLVSREENLVLELGIVAVELTPELQRRLPYLRKKSGVIVGAIAGGVSTGPAGLQPGDIIHMVNRREAETLADLRRLVGEVPRHTPLVLQVERSQQLRYVVVEHQ